MDVMKLADFLRGWSKGKVISHNVGNYWKCGKFATKIMPDEIDAMVNAGLVTRSGNTIKMVMIKDVKPTVPGILTAQHKQAFNSLANQLSPENLSCDGELSRAQVNARKKRLLAEWKALERIVGRTVAEDETYS